MSFKPATCSTQQHSHGNNAHQRLVSKDVYPVSVAGFTALCRHCWGTSPSRPRLPRQGSTSYHNLHISTCTHTKSWKRWRILLGRAQLQSQRYSTNLLHSLFMELIQEQEGQPQGKPCICICTKSLLLTVFKSALKFVWKEKHRGKRPTIERHWKTPNSFTLKSP